MTYNREYEGRAKAVLSDAYLFEAVDLDIVEPSNHFYQVLFSDACDR